MGERGGGGESACGMVALSFEIHTYRGGAVRNIDEAFIAGMGDPRICAAYAPGGCKVTE